MCLASSSFGRDRREDTPEDDGWTIVSNSEGGTQNYAEVVVAPGVMTHTVEWTLRALTSANTSFTPRSTTGRKTAAAHRSLASPKHRQAWRCSPFRPTSRACPTTSSPVLRTLGEATTVRLTTEAVSDLRSSGALMGHGTNATATSEGNGVWTFDIPASLEPVVVEWRVHLEGEGPAQTTPWLALQSEEPKFTVDETAAYVQAFAILFVTMVAFMSGKRRVPPPTMNRRSCPSRTR